MTLLRRLASGRGAWLVLFTVLLLAASSMPRT